MRGVDLSQHGGQLPQTVANCWKANGVEFAIVQYSQLMSQHLTTLRLQGIPAQMYVYLYWGLSPWNQTPADRVRVAIQTCKAFGITRLWLDCEDDTHPYQEQQLTECEALCRANGIEPGIYTAAWWWPSRTNNSTRFSHLPLWHAAYLGNGGVNMALEPTSMRDVAYGGWKTPAIWQWWGTTAFCSHSVDMNYALASVPTPQPTPVPTPGLRDGWFKEGNLWCLYNNTEKAVIRIGAADGMFPGRISKLFGDEYVWLRSAHLPGSDSIVAIWDKEEGD